MRAGGLTRTRKRPSNTAPRFFHWEAHYLLSGSPVADAESRDINNLHAFHLAAIVRRVSLAVVGNSPFGSKNGRAKRPSQMSMLLKFGSPSPEKFKRTLSLLTAAGATLEKRDGAVMSQLAVSKLCTPRKRVRAYRSRTFRLPDISLFAISFPTANAARTTRTWVWFFR